jgi:hypothetical protein
MNFIEYLNTTIMPIITIRHMMDDVHLFNDDSVILAADWMVHLGEEFLEIRDGFFTSYINSSQ